MRCPYCNSLNLDRASFCTTCGRDIHQPAQASQSQSQQQPNRQPPRPLTPSPYPPSPPQPSRPPYPQPTRPAYPQPTRPTPAPLPMRATPTAPAPAAAPVAPPAPQTPAEFPPRTLEQLTALEPGALSYTVIDEAESHGRRKQIRILFSRCAPWQQMGTLLKAYKEQQAKQEPFETLIVQGVLSKDTDIYHFTNGQLCVDRNVRLGERVHNRYQVETSNGFDSDAIRIVLYE